MATSSVKKSTKKPVSRVGSVRMSKKKGFSFTPWQALVAVLFVAVAGYAVVRYSQASSMSANSFDFSASQLTGGTLTQIGGESYQQVVLDRGGSLVKSPASITHASMSNTSQVCVRVKFLTDTRAYVTVWNSTPTSGGMGGLPEGAPPAYAANTDKDFCVTPRVFSGTSNEFVGITFGSTQGGDASGTVLVNRAYGLPKPVTPTDPCKTDGTKCPPKVPSCSIQVAKSGSTWTAKWSTINLGTAKYGWDATLSNSATGNTTNNVGVNGTRVVSPRVGYNNTYTLKIYDGWAVTSTQCSATVPG